MDPTTRMAALDKVKAMTTHIGYPDEIMDDKKLEEYYEGLEINPDTYLESVLRMNVFGTDYAFNKLRKSVNKTDWVTHSRPAIVNAFYSSIENSIRKSLRYIWFEDNILIEYYDFQSSQPVFYKDNFSQLIDPDT